ncbi:hypothetical protein AARAC_001818 [Aspergillus arachidicola]|uniref:Prolyl 4-hydroxylase alpha subunit Fe(2+) 2OG dioxygenase domain-containing protein n=1 Tax=Aspergillus arachidicola TaxID=656916 RepID=A0A2G7FT91_9EURO|nr:hypothetical protein AARAC_001818 [Aspergillus arachidicola]
MPKRPRTRKFSQRQTSDDDAVSSREESSKTRSSHVPTSRSQPNDIKKALKELRKTIAGQRSAASFACGGTITICGGFGTGGGSGAVSTSPPVKVYWSVQEEMDANKVVLPLNRAPADSSPAALQQLASDCSPATLEGMEPANFATTFHPADFRIIRLIERILLLSVSSDKENSMQGRSISAELYKLNIYSGPSGLFKSHVDTPRSVRQVGSLVVCLPAAFKGGNLLVRHGGKEVDFDWAPKSATAIQWAAFYSDCSHEIKTVTEGDRLTLTYNFYVTKPEHASKVIPSSLVEPWTLPIYGQLDALFRNPQFLPNGGVLGIYCAHAYAHTSKIANTNLPLTLKGSDLVLYSVLHALGATVSIRPVLEVDRDHYNWGHGCETEDGELVGEQLHPYQQSSSTTEYGPLDQIIRGEWLHGRMTGITWLTSQKHWEQALSYVAYGNESSVETSYSAAAILATIPHWNKRSSS